MKTSPDGHSGEHRQTANDGADERDRSLGIPEGLCYYARPVRSFVGPQLAVFLGSYNMPKESLQKKLGRVRPPRVQITYDVETGGAIEKKELPFVVGVLADLSGQPDKPLLTVKDRKFVEIDRDNFDKVLAKTEPRLAFKVDNKLTNDDTKIGVELRFSNMEDFEPQNVVEQVEPLRKLIELRRKLSNLRSSLYGNDKLDKMLQQILNDDQELNKLCTEVGLQDAGSGKGN